MPDQKSTNRERIKEIVDGIERNIQELFQSEKYFDYLRTMSRFHNYSVNNTILIHMQRPYASTPVAGFQKWKQFGRHVKRGEKGLTIIAPTPLKRKIEEMELDPDTKAPILDQDGNVIMEEKTVEIPLFKPVKVFSADQTEGKPLPTLAADLTGDVRQYEAFMEALRRTSPVPIQFKPLPENMDGYYSERDQSIALREGMSEVQTVCAAIHEITHAKLHNREKDRLAVAAGEKEPPQPKDEKTMEVEAESCAYAVSAYYGIDTRTNSIGYIAAWSSGKELKELKASLETITKTVSELVESIDRHFSEICREQGIDLTAHPEKEPDTPEKYVTDFFEHMQKMYEAGLIEKPFSSGSREEIENAFLTFLKKGQFSSFHNILRHIDERANMPATAALRERLEKLIDQWYAALVCKIEPYLGKDSTFDRSVIATYAQQDGQLVRHGVAFVGTQAQCQAILKALESGRLTVRQTCQPDFEDHVDEELAKLEDAANLDSALEEHPMPDSPDGSGQARDTPAAEPSDTPERFASDLVDMLDRLYQEGRISTDYLTDDRDKISSILASTLRINPYAVRVALEQFGGQDTVASETKAMLGRLDELVQSVPLKEYVYIKEANPRRVGLFDQYFIQAYERTAEGILKPDRTLFFGTPDKCASLLTQLQNTRLKAEDFFQVKEAGVSRYTTKDGAELDALVGADDKVYMGRRDHYDSRGHYLNDDSSLIYLSDNEKMFDFIAGIDYAKTQTEMLAQGCFTMEDYAEFDSLRVGVLAQFEQARPLLFAGEPFCFIQPDAAALEQQAAPAMELLEQPDEVLYLVDKTAYLHIQLSDGSYDYTLYDKDTHRQLDGGQMAVLDVGGNPQSNFRNAADLIILGERELQGTSIEPVPLDMLDTLQNAEEQAVRSVVAAMQEQQKNHLDELREHFAQEDAALWDTMLDEYPLPDPSFPADELEQGYGYTGGDLLPLSKGRALELLEQDMTIYMVETDGNPAMVFDRDDLMEQPEGMMFAVPREEWEASPDFRQTVMDRMEHQEEREQAFLNHAGDCFAIYQLKDGDETINLRYEPLPGQGVDKKFYELAYTAPLPEGATLDTLWEKFNVDHPADYCRPSMSVSDIVALKQDGMVSCYYCDRYAFTALHDFFNPRQPTVAELEAQSKAGQAISLMDLSAAAHREGDGKRKSVADRLKKKPTQERKKTAQKKSAEKER